MKNLFQITKVKENKDGSAVLYIEYDKRFEEVVKISYNKKKCSKKLVSQFVLRAIKNGIKRDRKKLK